MGHLRDVIAVAAALGAALSYAAASVLQQRAAQKEAADEVLKAGMLVRLVRQPLWLAGLGADGLAYGLQFIALGHGSIVLVQLLLVSGLLFALPLGAFVSRCPVRRNDLLAGGLVVLGLGVFLTVAAPASGAGDVDGSAWVAIGLGGAAVIGILVVAAGRRPGARRATALGAAAGVANALVAVFSKSSADILAHGLVHALLSWQPYALIASGAASLLLASSAFQAGSLAASLPMLTVVDPLAAMIIGAAFFGESLSLQGVAPLMEAASLGAMVAGVFLLARSPLVHCTHGSEPRAPERALADSTT
jgi:drug/metabolite transporter (DMT)-like permease